VNAKRANAVNRSLIRRIKKINKRLHERERRTDNAQKKALLIHVYSYFLNKTFQSRGVPAGRGMGILFVKLGDVLEFVNILRWFPLG